MIKYFGHILIPYESKIEEYGYFYKKDDFDINFNSFKCEKCSTLIFYYKIDKYYWYFNNGKHFNNNYGWVKLDDHNITCEELIIKILLE